MEPRRVADVGAGRAPPVNARISQVFSPLRASLRSVREYAFELAMCACLEAESDGIIARQLGSTTRIMDVVEIRPGPGFDDRVKLTAETIPPLAIESDAGVGRARFWKDIFDIPSSRAQPVVENAIDAGFFEVERRNGRRYVRQTTRYPTWFDGLRAFENKPQLDKPGELERQLQKDVSLALFDEVILVTSSYVTGAHLNRIPSEVGVWRFQPPDGSFEVIRDAAPLPTDTTGIAIHKEHPARVDINPVSGSQKAQIRRRIAERAYGKGWRPEALPACENAKASGPSGQADDTLPYCTWKDRLVEPARECGAHCDGHNPATPPDTDPQTTRADRTPWTPHPPGMHRIQARLDEYLEKEH